MPKFHETIQRIKKITVEKDNNQLIFHLKSNADVNGLVKFSYLEIPTGQEQSEVKTLSIQNLFFQERTGLMHLEIQAAAQAKTFTLNLPLEITGNEIKLWCLDRGRKHKKEFTLQT